MNINTFLDRLTNEDIRNSHKPRLITNSRGIHYVSLSDVRRNDQKKIEKVLRSFDQFLTYYDDCTVDQAADIKIQELIRLINTDCNKYKRKHNALYLFFSRIVYGDIDKIRRRATNHLTRISSRFVPNIVSPIRNNRSEPVVPEESLIPPPPPYKNFKKLPLATVSSTPQPSVNSTPAEIENYLRSSKLKFYEFFAEKIQLTNHFSNNGAESAPIHLPLVEFSSTTTTIRLPKKLVDEGFSKWLEDQLKAREIVVNKKNTIRSVNGSNYTQEFTLTHEEALKLIQPITEKGINHLAKLVGCEDLGFIACYKEEADGNEPDVENTIAYNLAKLVPQNRHLFENEELHLQPHLRNPFPFVEFDDQGMLIEIAENQPALENLIKHFLGVVPQPHDATHFDQTYVKRFRIPRDKIENVLQFLGMDKIPKNGLPAGFNDNTTYIEHLINKKIYHVYKPTATADAIDSVRDSLAQLFPIHHPDVKPHVVVHPRGWLSIKIPQHNNTYVKSLQTYLNLNPLVINENFALTEFSHEFRVEKNELEMFLKKLKLENSPNNQPYLASLEELIDRQSLETFHAETNAQLDLTQTIARTLCSLKPQLKDFLRQKAADAPILDTDPKLIDVSYRDEISLEGLLVGLSEKSLVIKIPKTLNDEVAMMGLQAYSFGDYLSLILGINGDLKQEPNQEEYYELTIPSTRVKSFLERDLGLHNLPAQHQKNHTEIDVILFKDYATTRKFTYRGVENNFEKLLFDLFGQDAVKKSNLRYPFKIVGEVDFLRYSIPCVNAEDFSRKQKEVTDFIAAYQESHTQNLRKKYEEDKKNYERNRGAVPPPVLKKFHRKDEALQLKKVYSNVCTFFNQYQQDCGLNYPHGKIYQLDLKNSPIVLPEQVPNINKEQFFRVVDATLAGHAKLETYIRNFKNNFVLCWDQNSRVEKHIKFHLLLIIDVIQNNPAISFDKKRNALIEIAETCVPGTCMPGRLIKIQDVYQKLTSQSDDDVKKDLLEKVEMFKLDLLTQVLKYEDQSVHLINAAKRVWGQEFGLNYDPSVDQSFWNVTSGHKFDFEMLCHSNLNSGVRALIMNDRNNEFEINGINNYRERLYKIFYQRGLKPEQIDAELTRLMPEEQIDVTPKKKESPSAVPLDTKSNPVPQEEPRVFKTVSTLSQEAVDMLLIDIGVLYP